MKYTEFTGKTVEEAIEKGLEELSLTKETADIRVLEEGKKKLFGSVKARVEIAPIEKEETAENTVVENEEKATENGMTDGERTVVFLEGLFSLLKIKAETKLVSEDEKVEINVSAANTNSIIGKRGAMLDAIQTLAGAVANIGRDDYKRVVVDCENYRETREATLKRLAENLAQKAIRLGKKIKLEPMNPYERRIIHAALSGREDVKTESEGKEPSRYIVVIPSNLEDPNEPAIPAGRGGERRNDRGNRGNNFRGSKGGYNNRGGKGGSRGNFNGSNRNGGYKKFNRDGNTDGNASGGTTLKKSNDFFGIFLGNSGNGGDEEK